MAFFAFLHLSCSVAALAPGAVGAFFGGAAERAYGLIEIIGTGRADRNAAVAAFVAVAVVFVFDPAGDTASAVLTDRPVGAAVSAVNAVVFLIAVTVVII